MGTGHWAPGAHKLGPSSISSTTISTECCNFLSYAFIAIQTRMIMITQHLDEPGNALILLYMSQ